MILAMRSGARRLTFIFSRSADTTPPCRSLVTTVQRLQGRLLEHLVTFDKDVPSLTTLRNVAEHFDDYTTGKGRLTQISRHQLQSWSLGEDAGQGLVWRWLDAEFCVDLAHRAATTLYRNFLADANHYLANAPS